MDNSLLSKLRALAYDMKIYEDGSRTAVAADRAVMTLAGLLPQIIAEIKAKDAVLQMALEMIEYNKHERRHVRALLSDGRRHPAVRIRSRRHDACGARQMTNDEYIDELLDGVLGG